jgi:hypothetical protein
MNPASLAAALAGAQASGAQMAMAAKMIRMNAENAASIARVLEAAQQNLTSLAQLPAGVGGTLDIVA